MPMFLPLHQRVFEEFMLPIASLQSFSEYHGLAHDDWGKTEAVFFKILITSRIQRMGISQRDLRQHIQ